MRYRVLQYVVVCCSILQNTATLCNTPSHITTHCNTLQHTATHCNTLYHTSVQEFCDELGCTQKFSCPGGGTWQNGVVERQIRNLKDAGRSIMETSDMPEVTNMAALYQAADVLNNLPASANEGKQDCTGLSPNFVYRGQEPDFKNWFDFGSFCRVHLDDDHTDPNNRVTAASCVYLCKARHPGISGHVLWDYVNRRRLMVPSLATHQWNFFPLRKTPEKHMSHMLTFVQVDINSQPDKIEDSKDVDEKDDHPDGEQHADDHVAKPDPPV